MLFRRRQPKLSALTPNQLSILDECELDFSFECHPVESGIEKFWEMYVNVGRKQRGLLVAEGGIAKRFANLNESEAYCRGLCPRTHYQRLVPKVKTIGSGGKAFIAYER